MNKKRLYAKKRSKLEKLHYLVDLVHDIDSLLNKMNWLDPSVSNSSPDAVLAMTSLREATLFDYHVQKQKLIELDPDSAAHIPPPPPW